MASSVTYRCTKRFPKLTLAFQTLINHTLHLRPRSHDLGIFSVQSQPSNVPQPQIIDSLANGTIWLAMIPATPCSRSHHQNKFGNPAHHPVFWPLPVAPSWIVSMNVRPQPCGCSCGCGYSSGILFVNSGFESGIPWRPKLGNCGIWFVNICATVSGLRSWKPVVGDLPSFRSVARISAVGRSESQQVVYGRKTGLMALYHSIRRVVRSIRLLHCCRFLDYPRLRLSKGAEGCAPSL